MNPVINFHFAPGTGANSSSELAPPTPFTHPSTQSGAPPSTRAVSDELPTPLDAASGMSAVVGGLPIPFETFGQARGGDASAGLRLPTPGPAATAKLSGDALPTPLLAGMPSSSQGALPTPVNAAVREASLPRPESAPGMLRAGLAEELPRPLPPERLQRAIEALEARRDE